MDRGLSPKRAINLPPAFLTPSIQEYHIRNCLTFKKHTNLWIGVKDLGQTLIIERALLSSSTLYHNIYRYTS
ncbi:hypothetical protein B0192_18325 [Leptospira interrogans serovar Australis]|nr:hypothetical protein B0192_18325 [Leptospira interrogans serovar Australis]